MPSSRGSPNPGIEPESLVSPALAGGSFTSSATQGALCIFGCLLRAALIAQLVKNSRVF